MTVAAGCATSDEPEAELGTAQTAVRARPHKPHKTHEHRRGAMNVFPFDDGRGPRGRDRPARRARTEHGSQRRASCTEPQPVTEPAPQPAPEPVSPPVTEPAPQPAPEPAPQPAPEPASPPVTEPAPQPAPEPAPQPTPEPASPPVTEPAPQPAPEPVSTRALVLYDDTGEWAWLGELYAVAAGNLASHFGTWTSMPVANYRAGDMAAYSAAIYVGSTYDQPLPAVFLDDVLAGGTPVVWMNHNIWQLASRADARAVVPAETFAGTYGYRPWVYEGTSVGEVVYKGTSLLRDLKNGAPIMSYSDLDAARVNVLAQAVRPDGSTFPWALRSRNLTYVGEIPFSYIAERDRYLIFCDLLFDVLAPLTPERHRALVRIEDVHPAVDPDRLVAIADYLSSESVPFSIAAVPMYVDPLGVYSANGKPETLRLRDAPETADALKYMLDRGGTLVMHGFTHQYEALINPYTGVTADDFEFWIGHVDAADYVIYDGPVPNDSPAWALNRVDQAHQELRAAGLPSASIFEYPHYAGSAADSRAISQWFSTAYHRGLYFGGALGGQDDYRYMMGQFFPYVVRDTYGWRVLPENMGSYEPEAYNHHPARLPADLIAAARANLVVRDGVASFYFHPFLELDALREIVQGLKSSGYTFVSPHQL